MVVVMLAYTAFTPSTNKRVKLSVSGDSLKLLHLITTNVTDFAVSMLHAIAS